MTTKPTNPKVDAYLERASKWQAEQTLMRSIALDCGLDEELKWGVPCYSLDGSNIVLIHSFKEYCAYLFFKGALLKDPLGILVQQTENTQAARQIRFTNVKDIKLIAASLRDTIREAIAVEKGGLKVEYKSTEEFPVVEEFKAALSSQPALKRAFEALTPGRQRAYLLYFASAKQAKTRESRIAQCVPNILIGKGLKEV